ncbi:hypothetical protein TW80_14805 [Loktanella sp. S4079]|nr:hypothetical protein TW80_14805 [Loktanella sp. S4079]
MRPLTFGVGLACIALALMLNGRGAFGRVALAFGQPKLAAVIFPEPAWKGIAHYRAGQFDQATSEFSRAGRASLFNLGNAQAQLGEYANALEAYDLATTVQFDPQAADNFDRLRAYYAATTLDIDGVFLTEDRDGSVEEAPLARGDARAQGSGDAVTNTSATPALAEIVSRGEARVRQVFDEQSITANERWLATLADVPGEFLAERIYHEHKARRAARTGQEPQDTQW